ncbi:MAG: hypothetical protein V4574_08115 [Pseudomonadota bacterium]
MAGLMARGRALVDAAAARAVRRVAERVRAEVPGVTAEPEDGRVVIRGRSLRRRLIAEAGLRWIGGLLK